MSTIKKLVIHGYRGLMGQAIIRCLPRFPSIISTSPVDIDDNLTKSISGADAVVDFSSPSATSNLIACCRRENTPLVIGTTGHTTEEARLID